MTDKDHSPESSTHPPYLQSTASLRLSTGIMHKVKQNRMHPTFLPILNHLLTPLRPLVSATTSQPHPDFPATLLAYHLLTSTQLDNLARHYHQICPPAPATYCYPRRIPAWVGTPDELKVDLETKRRRFGRFIGLRGCESPVEIVSRPTWKNETEEELLLRLERGWQEALLRARQDEPEGFLLRKIG